MLILLLARGRVRVTWASSALLEVKHVLAPGQEGGGGLVLGPLPVGL